MIKAMLISMLPLAAQAGGWEEFQARCLDAYENMFLPVVDGLEQVASRDHEPGYRLSDLETLVLELAPDDAYSACRLDDQTGRSVTWFDEWIAAGVAAGRYEKIGENAWNSTQWIEPRIAVQKRWQGSSLILRVLETDLES